MKKIKILLDKKNRIIGYCDFGILENSIEIEVDDDFEFNNDIRNYIYKDNKLEYVVDLEEVKAQKREELKRIRAKKIDSDLEVNGNSFQVRERDLQNFYNLKIAVDIDKSKASGKLAWVLADNSIKEFSYTELMGVLGAYIARKQEIFEKFGLLTMQLEACNTVEEIEAIKWL